MKVVRCVSGRTHQQQQQQKGRDGGKCGSDKFLASSMGCLPATIFHMFNQTTYDFVLLAREGKDRQDIATQLLYIQGQSRYAQSLVLGRWSLSGREAVVGKICSTPKILPSISSPRQCKKWLLVHRQKFLGKRDNQYMSLFSIQKAVQSTKIASCVPYIYSSRFLFLCL